MPESRPIFGKKIISNSLYSILDLILMKISTIVVFIILVRILADDEIAAIGICTGYLVFISYLDVTPIRILLRDYPKISKNKQKRDSILSALFAFWGLQFIFMMLLYGALSVVFLQNVQLDNLSFLLFAVTLDFAAISFQSWLKIVYYSDFRQAVATRISLFMAIARLLSYIILYFYPTLIAYIWLLIINAVITCLVWGAFFVKHFHYQPIINKETPKLIKQALLDYGLWEHFNRTIINTLLMVDMVILSSVGQYKDLASYTIALRFASLLTMIPLQLGRTIQVTLSNYTSDYKRFAAINSFLKFNTVISLMQLVVVFLFGDMLIKILFGSDVNEDVLHFSIIISIGITLYNVSMPFLSIGNSFLCIRNLFTRVFLPVLLMGIPVLIFSAMQWGASGIAYGKILILGLLALAISLYVYSNYRFPISAKVITEDEKKLFFELFRRK